MKSLQTSEIMAHQLEESTRQQSTLKEWHLLRKPRVTCSRFREVCHVRGQSSAENLALRILRPGYQTAEMKRGLQMESKAVEEYCLVKDVNHYPCGFIIHPDAPWLGSSPDGLVYDPNAEPAFGLLEVKCPNVRSYVDCTYLRVSDGVLQLKPSHTYYWQVQGQLLITGLEWCDFVVYAEDDMFIQRIYKDGRIMKTMKEKVDFFYFYFYYLCFWLEKNHAIDSTYFNQF
ncbi:uncharacterized protein LOC120554288 [Perca fluviatilis]|uniref:uncharacterized protein LOC120554288 n=1 Tax=Perca fluviatilis TaxID=8168 RepID=UPI00196495B5|nr:uncharacterized protein LOC120554288 [Perca fluviatilis]